MIFLKLKDHIGLSLWFTDCSIIAFLKLVSVLKHILVPTDFSESAESALEAAVMLAKKFSIPVHLFTNIDLPKNWDDLSAEEKAADVVNFSMVERVIKEMEARVAAHSDVAINYSYAGGKLVESIYHCIEKNNINFVVMGSHGQSGFSEIFIGSNTQKVVRSIHCPVLVIKKRIQDIDFKKVVFASNFNLSEKKAFLRFKEIIAPFAPEIILLGIKTSFLFSVSTEITFSAMKDFEELAAPFSCKRYVFKRENIESSIREFAKEMDVDLIAISNHNRRPVKRMVAGSNVEALINHSKLPVLSIDFPN